MTITVCGLSDTIDNIHPNSEWVALKRISPYQPFNVLEDADAAHIHKMLIVVDYNSTQQVLNIEPLKPFIEGAYGMLKEKLFLTVRGTSELSELKEYYHLLQEFTANKRFFLWNQFIFHSSPIHPLTSICNHMETVWKNESTSQTSISYTRRIAAPSRPYLPYLLGIISLLIAVVAFVLAPQGYTELKHCIHQWEQEGLVRNTIKGYEDFKSVRDKGKEVQEQIDTLLYQETLTLEGIDKLHAELEELKPNIDYLMIAPPQLKASFQSLLSNKTIEQSKKTDDLQFHMDTYKSLGEELSKKKKESREWAEKLEVVQKDICRVLSGLDEESKKKNDISEIEAFLSTNCQSETGPKEVKRQVKQENREKEVQQEVEQGVKKEAIVQEIEQEAKTETEVQPLEQEVKTETEVQSPEQLPTKQELKIETEVQPLKQPQVEQEAKTETEVQPLEQEVIVHETEQPNEPAVIELSHEEKKDDI